MQGVTLVRRRVRKEVTILSVTLCLEAEQWCLALRDAQSEDIGNGVEIVDFSKYNRKKLARADVTWTSNILFCRERTNTLFEAVMDKLKTGTTMDSEKEGGKLLVTGAPGIGKSAMLYRVMREAFQEKRTVVFDRRQEGDALIFVPKNDSYECWRYRSFGRVDGTLDVLRDPETFLLVDPSGKASGLEPPITPASTLITASSNPDHYRQFMKNPHSWTMFMANWTLDELLAVRKRIRPTLSEEDVRQRFVDVGGIVRHVFQENYVIVLREQEGEVKKLALEKLTDLDQAHANVGRGGVSNYVFTYDVDVTKPLVPPPLQFTSLRVIDLMRERGEKARD
jgi:GTPase SAR1 family protein